MPNQKEKRTWSLDKLRPDDRAALLVAGTTLRFKGNDADGKLRFVIEGGELNGDEILMEQLEAEELFQVGRFAN